MIAPMIATRGVRKARQIVCHGYRAARFEKLRAHKLERRVNRAALTKHGSDYDPIPIRADGRNVA